MISAIYQDEPHEEPGMAQRTAVALELRDYVVTKTAAKVWGSVMSTVFGLLVVLGLFEAYVRTSPLVAVALVGMYGVYSERRDVVRSVSVLLWLSYLSDAFWFCSHGPLHLTWQQLETAARGCAAPPHLAAPPTAPPPSAPLPPWAPPVSARALSVAGEVGAPAHHTVGQLLCQSHVLTANYSLDGMLAPALLLTLSALLKLLALLLLSGLDTALDARHGKGPAAALAGWAKSPVSLANWASAAATVTLAVGMITIVARDGADPTCLASLLVLVSAHERRNDLLGAAAFYLGLCLGLDLMWLNAVGLGGVGLQGAAAQLGEALSNTLTRQQMATCLLVLLSSSLKLATLAFVTLLLCTPQSDWLSSSGTLLSPRHTAVPNWLKAEGEEEDDDELEEDTGGGGSGMSDGGMSLRSHFSPGSEHILVHATRKEMLWGNIAAAIAHILLALSLVSASARRDPTPLIAAWIIFSCRLFACKLIRGRSALKKLALSVSIAFVAATLALDAAWLSDHATSPLGTAAIDLLRGDATAALELSTPVLCVLLCIVASSAVKLALIPVLLKAVASVRLPVARLIARQRRAEAAWSRRCFVVLHLTFFLSLLSAPLHLSPALSAAALAAWAVAQATQPGAPLLVAAAALVACPAIDAAWVLSTQGISLRGLLLVLRGDLSPIAHQGQSAAVLVLTCGVVGILCLLAALLLGFLKATVVPVQEPASPAGGGASHLFKLLSTLLLASSLACSVYPFSPSLPVAALAVAVGSVALPSAHRSRTDTLLLWLFKAVAAATALTQAAWLLWYGPARLLRQPAAGGVPAAGVFRQQSDALRSFMLEVEEELGSGDEAEAAADWQDKATRAAAAMHLGLTLCTTLLLCVLVCLSSGRLRAARQVAGSYRPSAPASPAAAVMM